VAGDAILREERLAAFGLGFGIDAVLNRAGGLGEDSRDHNKDEDYFASHGRAILDFADCLQVVSFGVK
jgi:hypothetical protein